MKSFLRILTIFFLVLTTNCSGDTLHLYKNEIDELLNPKKENITKSDRDVNDLRGCQYLKELGKWVRYESKYGNSWDKENVWKYGSMNTYKLFVLHEDENGDDIMSNKIIESDDYLVYVGPWKYYPAIQKNIRFFAYTGMGGGDVQYHYEAQTNENKNIPERPFSLPIKNPKGFPSVVSDRFNLCVVKWTAKYGYNAVAELEYPGFFNKIFRVNSVPTGRIIEVKE